MPRSDSTLFDMKGEASLSAYDAFQGGVDCLSLLNELAGERTLKEAIFLAGWMIVYQLNLESQEITERLDNVCERLEEVKPLADFWMISDVAALDKAKELGLDIPPEWSIADLRYMLDLKIKDNIKGSQFEPRSEVEVNLIKSVLTKHFIDSMTELPSIEEHESAVARIERIARGW